MIVAVLKLDFLSAFYYNAALMILLPILFTVGISLAYRYVRYCNNKLARWHKILLIICFAIYISFGILRNIYSFGLSPQ